MTQSGYAAFGTVLEYTDGNVVIGGLTKIGGLTRSSEKQETTAHDSAGGYKEYIPTLKEPGEIQIEGQMKPADPGQVALLAHFDAGDVRAMRITYPDGPGGTAGSTWEFDAEVTNLSGFDAPVDGVLTFTATLQVTGLPVFTPVGGS